MKKSFITSRQSVPGLKFRNCEFSVSGIYKMGDDFCQFRECPEVPEE